MLDFSLDSSFSNKLLGVEEMISRNLIYFHLLIDFSLSSFLMKKNHRFSSLPKTFSIQFSTLHPLDHHLCMILPSESSPLPPTKHLLCFYLNRLLLSYYSSLAQVAVTSLALSTSPPLSTCRSQLIYCFRSLFQHW